MIDYDIFVRRNCKRDVNLEAVAVTVLVARCDHTDATADDAMIVRLQSLDFTFDCGAHGLRWLASFEIHLQWYLHNCLSGQHGLTPAKNLILWI